MIQRAREFLALILIGVLPFHALLVTIGTKLLLGPGHAPWGVLAVWKEALLLVILLIAALEFLRKPKFALDLIDGLIVAFLIISFFLLWHRPWMSLSQFALGFKYDFVPLIAFMILRRVDWSDWFRLRAASVLLFTGLCVSLYGLVALAMPTGFFRMLGYSDAHSLYIPNGPLAAFQQISGSVLRRAQSTFSGPNQFGLWVLIPFSIISLRAVTSCELRVTGIPKPETRNPKLLIFSYLALIAFTIILTFSRSAWIAAFVIAAVIGWQSLPKRAFREAVIGVASILAIIAVTASLIAPSIFFRATSTWGHLVRPLQAMHEMIRYPLGMGLGSVGPAANRLHEPCVYLPPGSDPSWAKNSPQLCVFVGQTQAQPADHQCNCALLPENWYLQVGVELGFLGFALYLFMVALVLWKLRVTSYGLCDPATRNSQPVFLIFVGVSIAALFLHAWEDAAVAYTVWILIAGTLHPWFTRAR